MARHRIQTSTSLPLLSNTLGSVPDAFTTERNSATHSLPHYLANVTSVSAIASSHDLGETVRKAELNDSNEANKVKWKRHMSLMLKQTRYKKANSFLSESQHQTCDHMRKMNQASQRARTASINDVPYRMGARLWSQLGTLGYLHNTIEAKQSIN